MCTQCPSQPINQTGAHHFVLLDALMQQVGDGDVVPLQWLVQLGEVQVLVIGVDKSSQPHLADFLRGLHLRISVSAACDACVW